MTTHAKALDELKPGDTYTSPAHGWTCFHCGETFGNQGAAALHFGGTPEATAGCLLKVRRGEEAGLLYAVRVAEQERGEALVRLNAVRLGLNKEMEEESVERYRATRDINWPPSLPDTPRGREEIARIIDSAAFNGWQALYDSCMRDGNTKDFSERCANQFYKAARDEALAKAAVLALPPATPRPVEIEEVTAGRTPTLDQIDAACLSFRHDFGMVGAVERRHTQLKAIEWLQAWRAALPQDTAQDEEESDDQIDERLAKQEARDNLRLLDFIADKIGLPHNEELSRENFLAWFPAQDTADRTGAEPVGWQARDKVRGGAWLFVPHPRGNPDFEYRPVYAAPALAATPDENSVLPAKTIAHWFLDNHEGVPIELLDDLTDLIVRARKDGERLPARTTAARTERREADPVQDIWFTDRRLPIMAMSGDHESERVLKLHFRRAVTDKDRARLVEVLNAGETALSLHDGEK